jgi:hypothetical protein
MNGFFRNFRFRFDCCRKRGFIRQRFHWRIEERVQQILRAHDLLREPD